MRAATNVRLLSVLALSVCSTALIPACHSAPYVWVRDLPPQHEPAQRGPAIEVGDVIEVTVFGQESLKTTQKVAVDGTITVPLLGPVAVVGTLPVALAAQLTDRWRPFVNDPRVTVVMHEALVTVTVVGEVEKVGVVELPPPVGVLQVIAKVGGLGKFAHPSQIFVLRNDASGRVRRIRFTYDMLLEGDPAATAFRVHTGDTLVVQ